MKYWIIWGYRSMNGHTPGSDSYDTFEARQKVLDDETLWRAHCYPSGVFETDATGEVI